VIVDDLDVVGAIVPPREAHTPLIVDPYAVLTAAIGTKGLESIARRDLQARQRGSGMELQKFAARHSLYCPEPTHVLALEQGLGVAAGK
jgi:hypothetical protein